MCTHLNKFGPLACVSAFLTVIYIKIACLCFQVPDNAVMALVPKQVTAYNSVNNSTVSRTSASKYGKRRYPRHIDFTDVFPGGHKNKMVVKVGDDCWCVFTNQQLWQNLEQWQGFEFKKQETTGTFSFSSFGPLKTKGPSAACPLEPEKPSLFHWSKDSMRQQPQTLQTHQIGHRVISLASSPCSRASTSQLLN